MGGIPKSWILNDFNVLFFTTSTIQLWGYFHLWNPPCSDMERCSPVGTWSALGLSHVVSWGEASVLGWRLHASALMNDSMWHMGQNCDTKRWWLERRRHYQFWVNWQAVLHHTQSRSRATGQGQAANKSCSRVESGHNLKGFEGVWSPASYFARLKRCERRCWELHFGTEPWKIPLF